MCSVVDNSQLGVDDFCTKISSSKIFSNLTVDGVRIDTQKVRKSDFQSQKPVVYFCLFSSFNIITLGESCVLLTFLDNLIS